MATARQLADQYGIPHDRGPNDPSWFDIAQEVRARHGQQAVENLLNANYFEQGRYGFSEGDRENLWNWLGGEVAREQAAADGGSGLGKLAKAVLATVGLQIGGASGASAATGNGVTPDTIAADLAGLAIGSGMGAMGGPEAAMAEGGGGGFGGGGELSGFDLFDEGVKLDPRFFDAPPTPQFVLPSGGEVYAPPGVKPPAGSVPYESQPQPASGAKPGGETPAPADEKKGSDTLKKAAQGISIASNVGALMGGNSGGAPDIGGELEETEEERQARIAASTEAINSAFSGFGNEYYSSIADQYRNYATPLFQEQVSEARRRLPMGVPHRESSAFIRRAGELERDIGREEVNLGRTAIGESNRRRGEVDFARSELLGLANTGASTESVASEAAARAQAMSAPPEFSPIADLFGKFSQNAVNMAMLKPQTVAQQGRPLQFSHSPKKSVRNVE